MFEIVEQYRPNQVKPTNKSTQTESKQKNKQMKKVWWR